MTSIACRVTWIVAVVVVGCLSPLPVACAAEADGKRTVEYAIVLHGGALDDEDLADKADMAAKEGSLKKAIELGAGVLAKGGTSLDAVEQVVRFLEDDPLFNAGRGAVFNSVGGHELDASIMDGRTRACGAVAGVKTVKNPISLARLVMTKTRHVLLAAEGAEKFASEMEVERVDPKYFDTDKQFKYWQQVNAKKAAAANLPEEISPQHKGTVGCVALDKQGNLAAATSTGGLTNKKFGRIGDSPIIGAGTYADNGTCAVSCTGIGEQFIRNAVSHDVSARMKHAGATVQVAARQVIHDVLKKADGGLIAIGCDGTIVMEFNTAGMSRAAADSSGRLEVRLGANPK